MWTNRITLAGSTTCSQLLYCKISLTRLLLRGIALGREEEGEEGAVGGILLRGLGEGEV